MIALLVWTLRAWRWRLVGTWQRRGMRRRGGSVYLPRQPPDPPPAPDPFALLRRRYAEQQIPPGRTKPIDLQLLQRLMVAVRREREIDA